MMVRAGMMTSDDSLCRQTQTERRTGEEMRELLTGDWERGDGGTRLGKGKGAIIYLGLGNTLDKLEAWILPPLVRSSPAAPTKTGKIPLFARST